MTDLEDFVLLTLVHGRNRGFDPSRCAIECHLGQVFCVHVPLSPNSKIWNQRKLGSKRAHPATHWPRVLAASVGVWLRANKSKISAAPWAKWLAQDFVFFACMVAYLTYFQDRAIHNAATMGVGRGWLKLGPVSHVLPPTLFKCIVNSKRRLFISYLCNFLCLPVLSIALYT